MKVFTTKLPLINSLGECKFAIPMPVVVQNLALIDTALRISDLTSTDHLSLNPLAFIFFSSWQKKHSLPCESAEELWMTLS